MAVGPSICYHYGSSAVVSKFLSECISSAIKSDEVASHNGEFHVSVVNCRVDGSTSF